MIGVLMIPAAGEPTWKTAPKAKNVAQGARGGTPHDAERVDDVAIPNAYATTGSARLPRELVGAGTTSTSLSELSLSEAVYQHQIGERTTTMPAQVDRLAAAWPCFFGESLLGDIRSGKGTNPDNSTFRDGHKFACGLGAISGNPVVFSFGSHGDQQVPCKTP